MPSDELVVGRIECGPEIVCGYDLSVKISHSGLRVEHVHVVVRILQLASAYP